MYDSPLASVRPVAVKNRRVPPGSSCQYSPRTNRPAATRIARTCVRPISNRPPPRVVITTRCGSTSVMRPTITEPSASPTSYTVSLGGGISGSTCAWVAAGKTAAAMKTNARKRSDRTNGAGNGGSRLVPSSARWSVSRMRLHLHSIPLGLDGRHQASSLDSLQYRGKLPEVPLMATGMAVCCDRRHELPLLAETLCDLPWVTVGGEPGF